MATVNYLPGGELVTAELMNVLFEAFDGKMATMLSGKSFFLSQDAAMPRKFCGKSFFFTSGMTNYAQSAPNWVDSGGGVALAYNHSVFTTAIAAIDPATITWDEVNKVAQVPAFTLTQYQGLPNSIEPTFHLPVGTGLLDWSLQAHYILHQGASDSQPVPYYIQENSYGPSLVPEKRYNYGVAEIIMEGVGNIEILQAWDKYNCFRIHNLSHGIVSCTFENAMTVDLGPLECKTVRRKTPTSGYQTGMRYFWPFKGGDPRFYWFMPKGYTFDGSSDGVSPAPDDGSTHMAGTCVTNSEAANNLMNPAILLDWAEFYARDAQTNTEGDLGNIIPSILQNGQYAGWVMDPSVQANIYPHYGNFFGDPANPNTLIGDLIHHKGPFLILRQSRTITDPVTGQPVLTTETARFNGYATIVSDFAAHQLQVAPDINNNLVITSTDPDNHVFLVPYGTNLFKQGEQRSTIIDLDAVQPTIENAILENGSDPTALSDVAAQVIFQPVASTNATSITWYEYDSGTGAYDTPELVSGDTLATLNWSNAALTQKAVNGIHALKVSDLLTMDYWGDPAVPGQSGTYMSITNRSMQLTPEGLLILYTETDSPLESTSDTWFAQSRRGFPIVKSISFRGHGFGFIDVNQGSRTSGWFSCRDARRVYSKAYTNDIAGPNGVDFSVGGQNGQTTVQVLGRFYHNQPSLQARFWTFTANDWLVKFMDNFNTMTASDFAQAFGLTNASDINTGVSPLTNGTQKTPTMTLLPEMYNELARYCNSLTKCMVLSWKCLRWNIFGNVARLASTIEILSNLGSQTAETSGGFDLGTWDAAANTVSPARAWTGLQSGVGIPGGYYEVNNAGTTDLDGINDWSPGDIAFFQLNGTWTKLASAPGSSDWGEWFGPVPMQQFAQFEANSQYQALCQHLGIPVLTQADFPGGLSNAPGAAGSVQPFSYFQTLDTSTGVAINICKVNAGSVSQSGSGPATVTCTVNYSFVSELLETGKLLRGEPTGTFCLGTWSDSLLPLDPSNTGSYYVVAADETGGPLGDLSKGEMVFVEANGTGGVAGFISRRTGVTLDEVTLTQFATYCWCRIADVQSVIEGLGFAFSFLDIFRPFMLLYNEDNFTRTERFGGNASGSVTLSDTVPFPYGTLSTPSPAFYLTESALTCTGAQIRFAATDDASKALWKNYNMAPILQDNNRGYTVGQFIPGASKSPVVWGSRFSASFDAGSLTIGAGGGLDAGGGFSGNWYGVMNNLGSAADVGYVIADYTPTEFPEQVLQVNSLSYQPLDFGGGSYAAFDFFQQYYIVGVNLIVSSSLSAVTLPQLLTGRESYGIVTDCWLASLAQANAYFDSGGPIVPNTAPYNQVYYQSPPAPATFDIVPGMQFITAPANNQIYQVPINTAFPLVSL